MICIIFLIGPMGVFEMPSYCDGTNALVDYLSSATSDKVTTIVGGGDTVRAIHMCGLATFSHISTGGGAALEMLEGKTLPGVAALMC
jgi:phosphoglycerate kinase